MYCLRLENYSLVAVTLLVSEHLLHQVLKGKRVGSLDGEAESSAPDLSGHDTESSGNTKEHGVVVELVQAVVHEEGAGAGVNVGPRVADLASGLKHVGDHSVAGLDKVDEIVVLDILVSEGELAHEARVGLAEHGVTVSGNDLAAGEGVIDVLSDVVLSPLAAKLCLEVEEELEALLVGETVKGASETIHTGRE